MSKVRHVLGVSGGKDSAALAIYMRDKVPEMEYFFTDTGAELPEVYTFLDRLEGYLNKPIARLNTERPFEHILEFQYNGFLPSASTRWCTTEMKIKPFEKWIGDDETISYIAIRADEDRGGYRATKPTITAKFPFKEDGLVRDDIDRLLKQSGVGWPEYYKWRSRSGCYFCFFQRKSEWVSLAEEHPDLFERAKQFEKEDSGSGNRFTWSQGETLDELVARASDIKAMVANKSKNAKRLSWQESLALDEENEEQSCLICEL